MSDADKTVVRITLLSTTDPHTRLRRGDTGTLRTRRTDPWGGEVITVDWDNGSSLSLIAGHDSWLEN